MGAPDLRIGTRGWNYPSAAARGTAIFYPPARGRPKGFDELAFYAEHFDTVEVNSTFYGQPRAGGHAAHGRSARRPASSSPSSSTRSSRTRGCSRSAFASGLPAPAAADERRAARRARAAQPGGPRRVPPRHRSAGVERQARRAARAVSAELQGQRRRRATTSCGCSRAFADYRVAVELRHRSWSDAIGETLALLNAFGAAWVQIDEPKFRFSIRQNYLPNVEGFYYMRLHGRNAEQWWRHDRVGGPLQLSVLGRRAEGVRRDRGRRADRWSRSCISTPTTTSRRSRSPTPR